MHVSHPTVRAQEAKAKAKAEELASLPNLQPELCAAFDELAGTAHTRPRTLDTHATHARKHVSTHASALLSPLTAHKYSSLFYMFRV
jgi:hypothetical protein